MELTKEQFLQDFKDILHEEQLIKVEDATPAELFQTLAHTIRKYITPVVRTTEQTSRRQAKNCLLLFY